MEVLSKLYLEKIRIAQALSGKWTIPILLNINPKGDRFTPLQHRIDITPTRLNDGLKKLCSKGWLTHLSPIERRHPLLPEYLLTKEGFYYREFAKLIHSTSEELELGHEFYKKWSIPILLTLEAHANRFTELKATLSPITPKVLSTKLNFLEDQQLVTKSIISLRPIVPIYGLSELASPNIKALSKKIATYC